MVECDESYGTQVIEESFYSTFFRNYSTLISLKCFENKGILYTVSIITDMFLSTTFKTMIVFIY